MTGNPLESDYAAADSSPGFLLWRVSNAWQRAIRAALTPHGLTHTQYVLLAVLVHSAEEHLTQRNLADKAHIDIMMTSQVLRTLETAKHITRSPHPIDRRAMNVQATTHGRHTVIAATKDVETIDREFFGARAAEAATLFTHLGA